MLPPSFKRTPIRLKPMKIETYAIQFWMYIPNAITIEVMISSAQSNRGIKFVPLSILNKKQQAYRDYPTQKQAGTVRHI